MRCIITEHGLQLRKEGVFLCLDGTRWSPRYAELYRFCKAQCQRCDIPLKLGWFSWPQECAAPPDAAFLDTHHLSQRGRFLTPLIESVFPAIPVSDYDLILVAAGPVHDLDDWRETLDRIFHACTLLAVADLEKQPVVALEEEWLRSYFHFPVDTVTVTFHHALCYEFPAEFRLTLQDGQSILSGSVSGKFLDLPVKTWGVSEAAQFTLEAGDFRTTGTLPPVPPQPLEWNRTLSAEARHIFDVALDAYQHGQTAHDCPLCGRTHEFQRPLVCRFQKNEKRLFATSQLILREVEAARPPDARYLIFRRTAGAVDWDVMTRPVACLDAQTFIVAPDQGAVWLARMDNPPVFSELREVHPGLWHERNADVYVLTL